MADAREIILAALNEEADNWLTSDHELIDWIDHILCNPSNRLEQVLEAIDRVDQSVDDDEEMDDMLDDLIFGVYIERNGQP